VIGMGDSNREWGDLAAHDEGLAEVWDSYERLPERGGNDVLDAFVEHKRIRIPALLRVGAKLASYNVLAFAFPGGIKYRNTESGQRWSSPGAEFTRLKIVPAGAQGSDTVIVCESETDGARLTLLYDCDVAVQPAGAKRFTPTMAAQLEPYRQVLAAQDNDEAGDAGAEKIAALVPHAQRFAPPGVKDWCLLNGADPPPLPDPAQAPPRGLLGQCMSLVAMVRDGVPPPEFLPTPSLGRLDLFYAGHFSIFGGHKKVGKTLLAIAVALDAMKAGRHVVYLDFENGAEIIAERLKLMGADADLDAFAERFHYVRFPRGLKLDNLEDRLAEIAAPYPGALLVLDSLRGLFAQLSGTSRHPLEINNPVHIEQVLSPVHAAVKRHGLTVLLLDHAKKGAGKDDTYSLANSAAKEQIADAVYFIDKPDEYSEDHEGSVLLKITSDRRGRLPVRPVYWRVGGQGAGHPLAFHPVDASKVGTAGRIRRDVLDYLQDHAGDWYSLTALEQAPEIKGKASDIRDAVKALAADPDEPVGSRSGKGGHPEFGFKGPSV
jgi:hypothetical protein